MRLIDADKLRINCFCVDRICVDGRTIENAPTIKAIPIEWLEMQLDVFGEGFYDLRLVIEHWEKENEG